MDAELRSRLLTLHPAIAAMSEHGLGDLLGKGQLRTADAGDVIFEERTRCQGFPLLLEGSIRVAKTASDGREILLYRVVPGEACLITTSCLLGSAAYTGRGVAEAKLQFLVVPPPVFARLVATEEAFRTYVFALFSERVSELMQLVDAVAFQRLDRRLAALLLGKGREIRTTHQQLAEDLGSAREIVSRLLKDFADKGLVALGRERIEIRDAKRLRDLARS